MVWCADLTVRLQPQRLTDLNVLFTKKNGDFLNIKMTDKLTIIGKTNGLKMFTKRKKVLKIVYYIDLLFCNKCIKIRVNAVCYHQLKR